MPLYLQAVFDESPGSEASALHDGQFLEIKDMMLYSMMATFMDHVSRTEIMHVNWDYFCLLSLRINYFILGLKDQPFQEEAIDRKCERLEIQCCSERQQLETSEEQRMILECECNQLRKEKASLLQTLSISKQDIDILRAEKEELVKELNLEKQMMKDLKEEIQLFSLAFSQREGLLTSLYTKSKAIVENLKSFQVTTPELYD